MLSISRFILPLIAISFFSQSIYGKEIVLERQMGSEVFCGNLSGVITKESAVLSVRFTAENRCNLAFQEWNNHILAWDYCKETKSGVPEMGELSFGRSDPTHAGNWIEYKFRCTESADKINWNRYVKQVCQPTSGDLHIPYCDVLKTKYSKEEITCPGRCETMDNMRFLDWKYR